MHLVLICSEFPPVKHGGIGSYAHDLSWGLVEQGHQVTVIGIYRSLSEDVLEYDRETTGGPRVIRLHSNGLRLYNAQLIAERWQLRRQLSRLVRENSIDLIECADYEGWLPMGSPGPHPLILRLQGTNLLFDRVLGRKQHQLTSMLETRGLRKANAWLGVSQFALEATNKLVPSNVPVREIIPNCVDTKVFCPSPDVAAEEGLLLYVNSLSYRKGSEEAVAMACRLLPKRPGTRLVLIGPGPADYIADLQKGIPPELQGRIEFLGNQNRSTVLNWLRRAQVCLFPSKAETFGIAPVEAMAVEKPVIFMNSGPGPEVIENEVSGLLVDTYSVDELTRAAERLLDDPELCLRLSRNARERVIKLFDKSKWIQDNIAFYESLLARPKLPRS